MIMINPASVAFDIDGVVADTMSLFLEIARDVHNINSIRYEDICCYNLVDCTGLDQKIIDSVVERLLDGNYSTALKPIDGAADVLTRIESHHSPLLFVTARPYLGPIRQWLLDLLSLESHSIDVVTTGSFENKTEVLLKREITCFVEDRLDTCDFIHDAGILPVLYKQPWNRVPHPYREIGSWKELEALIEF
jgi:5'(3')-deoxyribonucleotidase